jgi:hypothetical protein
MSRNNRIGAALGHVRRRLQPQLQAEAVAVRLERTQTPNGLRANLKWELAMMYMAGFDRGVAAFKEALYDVEHGP